MGRARRQNGGRQLDAAESSVRPWSGPHRADDERGYRSRRKPTRQAGFRHTACGSERRAPTQGPNAGILIFQDRRSKGAHSQIENIIGGNGFSEFKGLIYFPSETLRVDGERAPDLQCARFIGKRLILNGRVLISKGCSSSNVMNFLGTEVRLIS